MELITDNWPSIVAVTGGILISDIVGMSRLKANSVIQLGGQLLKFLAEVTRVVKLFKKK